MSPIELTWTAKKAILETQHIIRFESNCEITIKIKFMITCVN